MSQKYDSQPGFLNYLTWMGNPHRKAAHTTGSGCYLLHMDTLICGATAFDYWRTPPLVQLLLTGTDDELAVRGLTHTPNLLGMRASHAEGSTLARKFLQPNPATRRMGDDVRNLRSVLALLSANHSAPVDVLKPSANACHASSLIKTHCLSSELPYGSAVQIAEDVWVTSIELALQQLAARLSVVKTAMLVEEACGSFAVYSPPPAIRAHLQSMLAHGGVPRIGGWEPLVTSSGKLSDLWSRPALTTPETLLRYVQASETQPGRRRLAQATDLARPNAASPFEARLGLLLGFSRRLGGEGLGGFVFNRKIDLSKDARLLAQRNCCFCDLYWEEAGLDLECQSALVHQNAHSYLSDSDRSAALKSMGINVLPVTYGQIKDPMRFASLRKTVALSLGMKHVTCKTEPQLTREALLRKEIFADWSSLHIG